MNHLSPQNDGDLLDLIEASLFEVPLAADEIIGVEAVTGVNLNRLVVRVKASLERARDLARRAAFAETELRLAEEKRELAEALAARPRLTGAQARARILALKERFGSAAAIEGYKLETLSDDDLNDIVAELELLLVKSQK